MARNRTTNRIASGRNLLRLAVAGTVALGTPLAIAGTADAAPESVWDRLAQCESGGKWTTNTGNGFAGGLQFTTSTWHANGGSGSPSAASRAEQIAVAERVLATQGWKAWPSCSSQLGLRGHGADPRPAAPKAAPQPAPQPAPPAVAAPAAPVVPAFPPAPVAPVAPAVPAVPAVPAPVALPLPVGAYQVQLGDTLAKIATQLKLAAGWEWLYERNKAVIGPNPNVIQPGQQLVTS